MNNNLRSLKKILVANRGEIAIRIFRAADELRLTTVAVFTYEDRYSLHRYKADEAYQIGKEDEPLKPYLDIEEIIQVAQQNEVDAIHPGYGFLSENTQFARRCREEGIIFIGPEPEVMEQLGDKIAAKVIARATEVPSIEDNKEELSDAKIAITEAGRIGYPVILKAAAGGGGRGMRIVREEEEMETAFNEAHREAKRAFGIDRLFMEKYIESPKHIEVQVIGDQHGNLIHLFERDCSVQRRFQKVVEIAPCPTISDQARQKLYSYALKICKHVNYTNAGTVEFLMDKDENLYFIEVNPRIQVEHTITEEITGIDIVRLQILIAKGHKLTDSSIGIFDQSQISRIGYAIQTRITTEDPVNEFKPDYGTLIAYRNAGGFGIRLDEGSTYQGARISPFFDSMLVKVSSHGNTLEGAAARLSRTLREFRIRGVKTNIPFLLNVINHPIFLQGKANVKFIHQHPEIFEYERKRDSGTKALRYLSEVIVNGNPDVKYIDPAARFRPAVVPEFSKTGPYPKGSKDRLTELGRETFISWLKNEKAVQYTDTTFRDAHQSLLATRVRTTDMIRVAEAFARSHPEVFSMEVWGGATFDVAMRFLHENPWKRLQSFRAAIPNILLQMLIRSSNAVGYTAYPDNLVEKFIEKAGEEGIDIFRIFDSLNWTEAMKVSIKAVRERTGSLAEACICYTGNVSDPDEKKYTLQYYLDMARQLEDEGAHILCIKDMAGLLKPYSAQLLVGELKKVLDIPIHLHTHDTSSLQATTYLKAIEAGVDAIDVALASMSGLTSQPSFNSIAAMMEHHERNNPLDIQKLNEFSNYWEAVREWYYPFESGLKAGTAEVYAHEIPGGQYSNLRPQARGLGLEDKFETIKKNYADVNELFGNIVKVTPSSKVVGDLALFMTANNLTKQEVLDRGEELSFPESVKQFFRGDLGQPHGGFPKKLQKLVLKGEKPYTQRPNAHLQPIDFDSEFEKFRKKFRYADFLDFLSWLFYPKVFEAYYEHLQEYGNVDAIPTPAFFYGLQPNEEVLVEIERGKIIIIKLLGRRPSEEVGYEIITFELNGQTRRINVRNRSIETNKNIHEKAKSENQVGAPLQGKLSAILVKPGDAVKKNTPLFIIEAMKMESTISASKAGKVVRVVLPESIMVEQDDLVLELE
ncbi:MAG: pyruvate carboxylase [Bacteroidia bacterium]